MKKILLLTVVLLIAITLSGCSGSKDQTQVSAPTEDGVSQEISMDDSKEGGNGIFNSIKEALISEKALECTFISSEDGLDAEVKSYVQGDKYKSEFMIDGKKNNSVFDGKVSYSWEEGSAQGVKIDMECLDMINDDVDEVVEVNEEVEDTEEGAMEMFEGAQNVECSEIKEIDFTIPSDVNFIDQCEMLKKQQELIKELDGQIPVGMPQF